MIKDIGNLTSAFGIEFTNLDLSMSAAEGNLVRFTGGGYLDEERLIAAARMLNFIMKANDNPQCKNLLSQIEMLMALTKEN